MVAEQPITMNMQILMKTLKGNTITIDADEEDTVRDLKTKIHNKERVPPEKQVLTFNGKTLEDDHKLSEYNVPKGGTVHVTSRLRGGMTQEELKNMLECLNSHVQTLQAALITATAQASTKSKESHSIIEAIRKGQMKGISAKPDTSNFMRSGNLACT